MKRKIFTKKIFQVLSAGILLLGGVFLLLKNSVAWTDPSAISVESNIFAPLNSSSVGQSKWGGLILNLGNATHGLIVRYGKVGIGTDTPQSELDVAGKIMSTGLEISSTVAGVLLPRLSTAERDLISNPTESTLIYNTTDKKFNYFVDNQWTAVGSAGGSQSKIVTESAIGDGRPGDYYCKRKNITTDGQQKDWILTNEGKLCGSNDKICQAGECKELSCGVDLYKTALTCSAVGTGYYSPIADNNRYACTNKPANSTYTGSGGGANNCPWICNSGYVQSGNSCVPSFVCGTSTVNDVDGNSYNTIQIGNQCWLKQNLKTGTKLASGSAMPTNNGIVEKWCYNNSDANCTTYGGLYHWDEAMGYVTTQGAQGICPAGWHIPTDAQQYELENYLKDVGQTCIANRADRGCSSAGAKLKSGGSSGFEGLLAGFRLTEGSFYHINTYILLWSSSQNVSYAFFRRLDSSYPTVYRSILSKAFGLSVRCLKD